MTNVYGRNLAAEATPAPKKRNKRKLVVISAVAAVVLAPIAAYAAVQIFGLGSVDQAAGTTTALTIGTGSDAPVTSAKLLPGKTVGVTMKVSNPNDFDVTVTSVYVKNNSLDTVGAKCTASVHLAAGTGATFPTGGAATAYNLTAPVVLPAGYNNATITVPGVFTQDAAAEVLCPVKADFAVVGANS